MMQKTTKPPIKPNQRVRVILPPLPSLSPRHPGEGRDLAGASCCDHELPASAGMTG